MRKQTQQERWAMMTIPQRQREYRQLVIMMSICLLALFGVFLFAGQRYISRVGLARQYDATQSDAREVTLPVTDQQEYTHSKGGNDYVLTLQEPGGSEHHAYLVNRDLWQIVNVGDKVKAQIWQDKVCIVQAKGMTSQTRANPDYALSAARRFALLLGAIWLFYTGMVLWRLTSMKRRIMSVSAVSTERIL